MRAHIVIQSVPRNITAEIVSAIRLLIIMKEEENEADISA